MHTLFAQNIRTNKAPTIRQWIGLTITCVWIYTRKCVFLCGRACACAVDTKLWLLYCRAYIVALNEKLLHQFCFISYDFSVFFVVVYYVCVLTHTYIHMDGEIEIRYHKKRNNNNNKNWNLVGKQRLSERRSDSMFSALVTTLDIRRYFINHSRLSELFCVTFY